MSKKIFTGVVIASALIYVAISCRLLLIRHSGFAEISLFERIRLGYGYNLIPFKTIGAYFVHLFSGDINTNIPIRNLIGNLLILMPLGFYLPFFARKAENIKTFIISVAALIIVIEVMQFVTISGSLDIDDFILNFTGSLIGFFVCKYTPIRSLFKFRAF